MAAFANLVLADGQTTPVNKTFTPTGLVPVTKWQDKTGGIAIGMPEVTISDKMADGVDGSYKINARIRLPVLEVISGSDGGYTPSPKVAYTCIGVAEFTFPKRSTLQNRKDVKAFLKNLLSDAVMTTAVENFELPY
jgi:hypothetical protein